MNLQYFHIYRKLSPHVLYWIFTHILIGTCGLSFRFLISTVFLNIRYDVGIAVVWFHCQRGHALHQVHDRDIDMFDCLSEWWTAPSDVDSAEVSFLAFLTAPRRLDKQLRGVAMISGAGLEL